MELRRADRGRWDATYDNLFRVMSRRSQFSVHLRRAPEVRHRAALEAKLLLTPTTFMGAQKKQLPYRCRPSQEGWIRAMTILETDPGVRRVIWVARNAKSNVNHL